MIRYVMLDANILIGGLNTDPTNQAHLKARERFCKLLENDEVILAITPLVRYEVLRGARNTSVATLNRQIDAVCIEFDFCRKEADSAAELYRYAVLNALKPEKRSFDVAHVACAMENKLEMCSADGDIPRLQALYEKMKKEPK